MSAFLVLVAASGLLFVALVEMAFTLLMRLPERLEAERESDGGALGAYLDDPLRFFVPARLMRGFLLILSIVLFGSGPPISLSRWSRSAAVALVVRPTVAMRGMIHLYGHDEIVEVVLIFFGVVKAQLHEAGRLNGHFQTSTTNSRQLMWCCSESGRPRHPNTQLRSKGTWKR